MKVLLTGANGFVGSHIAEELVARGHHVICLVRRTSDCRWLRGLPVEYRYGDVCGATALADAVRDAEAIVHSAAVVRALTKETYFSVNQQGTANLVEAARRHAPRLRKFIYLSSQAAMGPSPGARARLLTEPENPVSDYGRSKLAGERELAPLEGSVPWTVLRPASVYGPRDKDIFIFFRLVYYGLRPLMLRKRYLQLLYVRDLSRAVADALSNDRTNGRTYFLAEDRHFTLDEIGRTIAQAAGHRAWPVAVPDIALLGTSFVAERVSDLRRKPAVLNRQKVEEMLQPYWLADVAPAREDLRVDFTKLEIGAKITYSWYNENKWF